MSPQLSQIFIKNILKIIWTWAVSLDIILSALNVEESSRLTSYDVFGSNSTPKVNSWDEGCPPLIYSILTLSLADVGLGFFIIRQHWNLARFWFKCRSSTIDCGGKKWIYSPDKIFTHLFSTSLTTTNHISQRGRGSYQSPKSNRLY